MWHCLFKNSVVLRIECGQMAEPIATSCHKIVDISEDYKQTFYTSSKYKCTTNCLRNMFCKKRLIERKKIRLIWLSILAFYGRFEPWTPQLILLQRVINATVYAWPLTTKHGFSQSTRFKVPLFESTQSSDTVSRIPRFLRYAAVWIFYECSFVQEYTLFVMALYFSRFCNLADWK